jgi:hypothetical protein
MSNAWRDQAKDWASHVCGLNGASSNVFGTNDTSQKHAQSGVCVP